MRSINFFYLFITIYILSGCREVSYEPQKGDLLFQDGDCGDFCEAIETVTSGIHGLRFSHVGIIYDDTKGAEKVLEATSDGVIITFLDSFLARSYDVNGNPKVAVGRLKEEYQNLIPGALDAAPEYLGKSYDYIFDLHNDSYYCSELIYELFKKANAGNPIFFPKPMTFKDPATSDTFPVWIEYYEKLGNPIPEGQSGLNPGGISQSDKLEVLFPYSDFGG